MTTSALSTLSSSFEEVPAPSASTCWRCHGSGVQLIKLPPGQRAAGVNVTSEITCKVCGGRGHERPVRDRGSKRPRPLKEFPGWQAPGPQPVGDGGKPHLQPQDDEDLSYLCGHWRLFQASLDGKLLVVIWSTFKHVRRSVPATATARTTS
jgi:hypothetical protein